MTARILAVLGMALALVAGPHFCAAAVLLAAAVTFALCAHLLAIAAVAVIGAAAVLGLRVAAVIASTGIRIVPARKVAFAW